MEKEINIEAELIKMNILLKEMDEKQDKMQRQLDHLNNDRELLEDIDIRLKVIEEQWRIQRKSDKTVSNDIKEEISINGDKVKAAVEVAVESLHSVVRGRRKNKEKKPFLKWLFRR